MPALKQSNTRAPWGSVKAFIARLAPGQSIAVSTVKQADNLAHRARSAGRKAKWKFTGAKGSGSYLVTIVT